MSALHAVREQLAETVGRLKGRPAADFLTGRAALQLDSLDLVELSVVLEQAYGIELGTDDSDFDELGEFDTLCGLVDRRRLR
ncbi:acyl carrier protein [Streptomyces sp. NPDC055400]